MWLVVTFHETQVSGEAPHLDKKGGLLGALMMESSDLLGSGAQRKAQAGGGGWEGFRSKQRGRGVEAAQEMLILRDRAWKA